MIRRFFFLMTFSVALLEGAAWGQDGCRLKTEAVQNFCGSGEKEKLGEIVKLGVKVKELEDKLSSDPSVPAEKKEELKSQTEALQGLVTKMDQAVVEQLTGCIDPQKQALKDALRQRAQGDGSNSQAGEDVLDSKQATEGGFQATVAGNALRSCGGNTYSAAGKFDACASIAGNVSRNLGDRQRGASSCGRSLLQQPMEKIPEWLKNKLVGWSNKIQKVETEAFEWNARWAQPLQNYCSQSAGEARSTANACLNAANSMYQQANQPAQGQPAQGQPADDGQGEKKGGQGQQGGGQQGGENQPSAAKAETYPKEEKKEEKTANSLSEALANSNKDKQDDPLSGYAAGSNACVGKSNGTVVADAGGNSVTCWYDTEGAAKADSSANSEKTGDNLNADGDQKLASVDTSGGLATGGRALASDDGSSGSSKSSWSSSSRGLASSSLDGGSESASYSAIGSGGGSLKSGSGTPIEGARTDGNRLGAAFAKKVNLDCKNPDSKYYEKPVCQRQRDATAAVRAFSSSEEE